MKTGDTAREADFWTEWKLAIGQLRSRAALKAAAARMQMGTAVSASFSRFTRLFGGATVGHLSRSLSF